MASCATCNSLILFGGVKDGTLRFCNSTCQSNGTIFYLASRVPEDSAMEGALDILNGPCPVCSKNGPVDFHTSHTVWSAIYFTSFKSKPVLCCRKCGRWNAIKDSMFTAVFGWWGFPFGVMMTPIQLIRNATSIVAPPKLVAPSQQLIDYVKLDIAGFAMDTSPESNPNNSSNQ